MVAGTAIVLRRQAECQREDNEGDCALLLPCQGKHPEFCAPTHFA